MKTTEELLQAWADANPDCTVHDLTTGQVITTMGILQHGDIDDLLPSELGEDWPPQSEEEIEERQRQAEWQDYLDSIPDARERNRGLK